MKMNIAEAINDALKLEMKKNKNIVLLGEDVGVNGGVFRVTDGLKKKYPDRVFDTPLAELGIVGTSIGMALYGLKPIAEIQFMGFLWPALDQISNHASRIRNRTMGRYTSNIVIRIPYGGEIRGLEHHTESFESVLSHIPGLKVVIPSTPYDAKGLLISTIRDENPVVFLEPKKLYRAFKEEVPKNSYTEEIGKAKIVNEGDDLTILGWGAMMPKIKKAAELINAKGFSTEIIDLRTISPYDEKTVNASVEKTGRLVVVQEASRTCGFASEIIAGINDNELLHLKAPVARVTGFDIPFPLYKMEKWAVPDADRIIKASKEVLKW
ncbi:MAG: alpha-ketoacid dehydrogenase subunit beta [Candidatus Nanoarchaeia archaeon]|nr:alpha-ketoacid dehydrogenase subunit beta [Candidatus Nanoarchaeia archaeon]